MVQSQPIFDDFNKLVLAHRLCVICPSPGQFEEVEMLGSDLLDAGAGLLAESPDLRSKHSDKDTGIDEQFGTSISSIGAVLAVVFGLAVAFLLFIRVRNPILVRMAFRNVLRRPGQSMLILGGLMLATAIIASAFTVGDSVTHSIKNSASTSLRAVDDVELPALCELHASLEANAPIHIHAAEQMPEVEASLAFFGQRPVERLFDLADVNETWCLIHSTHMTAEETEKVARSGATVGLCPLTEANLGDGIFNGRKYLENGGYFGIGTDSNVCTDPFAELQMLEYSQRLANRQRTVLVSSDHPNTGQNLVANAAIGGGRATGRKAGMIAPGYCADFVELTGDQSGAYHWHSDNAILDYRVFAQNPRAVGQVVVGGKLVLDAGHHAHEDEINQAFRNSMARLCQEI